MWTVYNLASKYSKLPSDIVDEDHALDSLTRFLLNKAVTYFGMTIENLLDETVEVGHGANKRTESKYELKELMHPDFKLPRPQAKARPQDGLQSLMMLAKQKNSGVVVWGYTGNESKPS